MEVFACLWRGDGRGFGAVNLAFTTLLPKKPDTLEGTARRLNGSGVSAVMFKLDITKAFDTIDWAFLLEVLAKMGFGERWLSTICAILSSTKTKILLNGVPGDIINNKRGLRQGDPLCPMLFVKLMAVLNFMVQKEASEGLLTDVGARGL
ncbi:hypothetical protein ACQ4PT_050791 [Festuca glaucescens]